MNISNALADDLRIRMNESVAPARRMRRITFVASGFGCGGIQRAVASIANGLADRGHEISLVTLFGPEHDFFPAPAHVRRISLGRRIAESTPVYAMPAKLAARAREWRAAIRATEPEVVIAHAPHVNVQTLLACPDYPTIVTEHGDVRWRMDERGAWLWRKALWYAMRRLVYDRARKVVSVSRAVDANVRWVAPARRVVIHNPLTCPPSSGTVTLPRNADPDRPWLISVGRLAHAKGFDLLLRAFASVASAFPDWQLIIVGDGTLRMSLEAQAKPLGEQVVFAGAIREPLPLVRRSQWFVTASRYEGFPIAPGEALLCGVPVIATDCPSRPRRFLEALAPPGGIRELLAEDRGAVLVPTENVGALSAALERCMSDQRLRNRLATEARAATERFSLERVINEWESVIQEVARGTP